MELSFIYIICLQASLPSSNFIILSESWLSKAIPDNEINISGFSLFRCDCLKKGGGIAICHKFHSRVITVLSISKVFVFCV